MVFFPEKPRIDMRLDEWLEKKKILNKDFAKALGINKTYLSALLHGHKAWGPALALKVDELTKGKVSVKELLQINRAELRKVVKHRSLKFKD